MPEESKIRIRRFLESLGSVREMGDDDDIFARGYLSSLHAMRVLRFVEAELGVQVADEDLEIDNFRSINAIAEFVARKREG